MATPARAGSFSAALAVRIAFGCALSALSAGMLTLAFAPHRAWYLVWIGLVPMLVAQHRVLPGRLSALAPGIAVGGFVAGCFGGVFPERAAWYMKQLPLLVCAIVTLSSLGRSAARARAGYGYWPLLGAIGWVAIELVCSLIPALGTWGFLGNALYRQTWLLQPVAIFGTFGLDFVIVLVNYALALLLFAWLDRRRGRNGNTLLKGERAFVPMRLAVRWCAGVAAVCVLWGAQSVAMLPRGMSMPTVRVAALQPGYRWRANVHSREQRDRAILEALTEQTRRAAARGARFIVWPESALRADPRIVYREQLSALAKEVSAYLFVGYLLETPAGRRNEVVTIAPDGAFLGVYGKDHAVGFLGETSITRGTYPTYATPFGVVGAVICADVDFTDTPRKLARNGAKILLIPSADWPGISTKHYVLAVFRALETGSALVKSEYGRDSAIVDGYGSMLASAVTPEGSEAVLVADVASRPGLPLAARWGDWVGWLCVAALAVRRLARLRGRGTPKLSAAEGTTSNEATGVRGA
ncbi:MAG TPA: nitrilase-related carbon-nitrogen hydrolase [Polyangiaceae bacterium]|nr:nitrilase-related carbon-nitrogen hydrolase [Polyangiaceae bacterium]